MDTDRSRTIRETINYSNRFKGCTIVVKIGKTIFPKVETLGIVRDLVSLQATGLNVIVICTNHVPTDSVNWTSELPLICIEADDQVSEDQTTVKVAVDLHAEKLIFITNRMGVFLNKTLIREITVKKAREVLYNPETITGGMRSKLEAAVIGCEHGISRVHIISGEQEGSLLKEIMSCEGIGTMIYIPSPYHDIRKAQLSEATNITDILLENDFPIPATFSEITTEIDTFSVFVVDKEIHGCAMITQHPTISAIEISYLTVSSSYEKTDALQDILSHILEGLKNNPPKRVFLDFAKNQIWLGIFPWFLKTGFQKYSSTDLPWYTKKHPTKLWVKKLVGE